MPGDYGSGGSVREARGWGLSFSGRVGRMDIRARERGVTCLASPLQRSSVMTTTIGNGAASGLAAEAMGIVRWVFLKDSKAFTCDVRSNGGDSYDVCIVPHWDVSVALVERYDRPTSALHRHAEIARHFRKAGWLLVRQSPKPQCD